MGQLIMRWLTVSLLLPILATSAWAEPLFASHEPLTVHLELPLAEIRRLDAQERSAFAARLTVGEQDLPLEVSPRGKSRRTLCRMPPLRLDFKRRDTEGSVFAGQNKLKLVTHCSRRGEKRGFLAAEYAAYRVLNALTERSFRVRWLDVTYVDGKDERTHGAFVIEHKKALARRLDLDTLEAASVSKGRLDEAHAALVALFQYLVGNTDFSMVRGPQGDDCCHNMVPLADASGLIFAVPYDFDAIGLVDPPYAAPVPSTGIRRVTDRAYRGYCAHNEALETARQRLLSLRGELDSAVRAEVLGERLPARKRERMQRYLADAVAQLEDPKRFARSVSGRCR